MQRTHYIALIAICIGLGFGSKTQAAETSEGFFLQPWSVGATAPVLVNVPAPKPVMGPELALARFFEQSRKQSLALASYTDLTTIDAELPATNQKGHFTLRRAFNAPKTLAYKPIDFVGDRFVKMNVMARLLQSEVDHVEKDANSDTAISAANYKFNYKGIEQLNRRSVHVYQVKPRSKRVGLFKGKIYIDTQSGLIQRAEGILAKSPSIFVKTASFVQEYEQVGEFSLPKRLKSVTDTRLIGKAIVVISHDDYKGIGSTDSASEIQSR